MLYLSKGRQIMHLGYLFDLCSLTAISSLSLFTDFRVEKKKIQVCPPMFGQPKVHQHFSKTWWEKETPLAPPSQQCQKISIKR